MFPRLRVPRSTPQRALALVCLKHCAEASRTHASHATHRRLPRADRQCTPHRSQYTSTLRLQMRGRTREQATALSAGSSVVCTSPSRRKNAAPTGTHIGMLWSVSAPARTAVPSHACRVWLAVMRTKSSCYRVDAKLALWRTSMRPFLNKGDAACMVGQRAMLMLPANGRETKSGPTSHASFVRAHKTALK